MSVSNGIDPSSNGNRSERLCEHPGDAKDDAAEDGRELLAPYPEQVATRRPEIRRTRIVERQDAHSQATLVDRTALASTNLPVRSITMTSTRFITLSVMRMGTK